ncbi:unnamed protein product [Caenorhabditis brenneri]
MATRKKTDQSMSIAFFNTDSYSVACSNTYQCAKFDEWKTFQSNVRGACVTNSLMNDPPEVTEEIINTILPWPFLFTTIVGVKPYINITSEEDKIMYGVIPNPKDAEYMEEEKKDGDPAKADGGAAKTSGLSERTFIVALILSMIILLKMLQKMLESAEPLSEKALADQFIKTLLSEKRNSIKVMELVMNINPEYSEMYKKFIEFCDPAFIESIKIENVGSQEIYEDILKSPQWKNSQKVSLNWNFDGLLKVDIDDFLHFKSIKLEMEELSVEDAWKLVQNFLNIGSQNDSIDIRMEKPVPEGLIRQKIETELVGDWKDAGLLLNV